MVCVSADRSETARMLLELDDPAPAGVEDLSGQAAIVWMIKKMPPVVSAKELPFVSSLNAFTHLHNLVLVKAEQTIEHDS